MSYESPHNLSKKHNGTFGLFSENTSLSILGYNDEEDAINIANETIYGLSGYVSSENIENAKEVASKLRTGMVHINNAPGDQAAPFGGYKMSGNGREWGEFGFEEFLEIKAVMGYASK